MVNLGRRIEAMEQSKRADQSEESTQQVQEPTESANGIDEGLLDNPEVPTIRDLRRDYEVGQEVNRRLAEMDLMEDAADPHRPGMPRTRGKRSGAARTVQDSIVNDIDWPHFHVYSPPGAEPMTYEALTIPEFTYGYLHMVDQRDAKFHRRTMWDLLKDMMEDAVEYPWYNVKNFFWIAGSHVENDRMKWSDHEQIAKLRVKYAQKHDITPKKASTQQATNNERLRHCLAYQKGTCTEKGDHSGLRHMCAHCYKTKSVPYPHPEMDCRCKSGGEQPKNLKGGE